MATLGIFARRPVPGVVKTRLAASVGAEAAARFYQSVLLSLLTRLSELPVRKVIAVAESVRETTSNEAVNSVASGGTRSSDIEWFQSLEQVHNSCFQKTDKNVCPTENQSGTDIPVCPSRSVKTKPKTALDGYELWSQPSGNLGQKLAAWFEFGCAADERVVVIGSDSPTLPLEFVERAFDELESADCVIGPALDGGYYLLGLRRTVPELFEGIEWSSSRVLEQTLDAARKQNLRVVQLPPWNDVDEYADLMVLRDQLRQLPHDAAWEPLRLEVERLISDSRDSPRPGV